MDYRERITITPCLRGLRMTVYDVLDDLAGVTPGTRAAVPPPQLLVDENAAPSLAHHLSDLYLASAHVRDVGLATADDGQIWLHARDGGYLIVTTDHDYRPRRFLRGAPLAAVRSHACCRTCAEAEAFGKRDTHSFYEGDLRMLFRTCLCGVFLSLLACSGTSGVANSPACSIADVDRGRWEKVRTGTLVLELPAGFTEIPGLSVDSDVRGWGAPERGRIEYDYGMYSSAYAGGDGDSYVTRCTMDVDGWQVEVVRFVRANQGPSFHAYWLDAKVRATMGETNRPTLMMYGFAPDSVTRDDLLAVLPTVRRLR